MIMHRFMLHTIKGLSYPNLKFITPSLHRIVIHMLKCCHDATVSFKKIRFQNHFIISDGSKLLSNAQLGMLSIDGC